MVVTLLRVAALTLVAVLAAGCVSAIPAPAPRPFRTPRPAPECTTRAVKGRCGPYDTYPRISGTTSSTYVGNNVWNPISGWRQTLFATNPGNWQVSANLPAGNTAVVSYPSVGANYGQITDEPTPLTRYASIHSSFSETMNATAGTSAWAAYDIWLGQDGCSPAASTCTSHEVMIQHDFANNGACTTLAKAAFGGSGGIPVHDWHLCKYGSQLIWKLGADEENKLSERSGSVDVLSMLTWLVDHRYLPAHTGLWQIGYGWEICSTGGLNENFLVRGYSITPTPSRTKPGRSRSKARHSRGGLSGWVGPGTDQVGATKSQWPLPATSARRPASRALPRP